MSLEKDIEDKAHQDIQGVTRRGQRGQAYPDIKSVTRQANETGLEMGQCMAPLSEDRRSNLIRGMVACLPVGITLD